MPDVISITAFAFFIKTLGMGACAVRFLTAFRANGGMESGRRIGAILAILYLCNGIIHGMFGAGVLLSAQNSETWYRLLLISDFFLLAAAAGGAYLLLYILFPFASRAPGVIGVLLLGALLIAATISVHPQPVVSASGDIQWRLPYWLGINLAALIFINIGGPLFIFAAAFLRSRSPDVRFISLVVLVSACIGIAANFTRFILPSAGASAIPKILDASVGLLLLAVFLPATVVTQRIARIRPLFQFQIKT